MARGSANFDAAQLRFLRTNRVIGGKLLSLTDVAQKVGTSKARILAYESGKSTPEPQRIQQLAEIWGVSPRALYRSGARPAYFSQLRDLRYYAGLTSGELASRVGISRNTYRNLELSAVFPARDDGTLPLRLAEELGVNLKAVHRAIENHPAAAERREKISEHIRHLLQRAHTMYTPAVINPDEPRLVQVSDLLRRPPAVMCRIMNYELSQYRAALRALSIMGLDVAYAQSLQISQRVSTRAEEVENRISTAHSSITKFLVRFLSESMSIRQWRAMVTLLEIETALPVSDPEEQEVVWNGLIARRFVYAHLGKRNDRIYSMTDSGRYRCILDAPYYALLYPRVFFPPSRRYRSTNRNKYLQF